LFKYTFLNVLGLVSCVFFFIKRFFILNYYFLFYILGSIIFVIKGVWKFLGHFTIQFFKRSHSGSEGFKRILKSYFTNGQAFAAAVSHSGIKASRLIFSVVSLFLVTPQTFIFKKFNH